MKFLANLTEFCILTKSNTQLPSKKKYLEKRIKGAPLILLWSSKSGTPILQKQ